VAVVTNKQPVTFTSMEDINQKVPADIVFILGLNQPHATRDAAIINEIITR
jgi:PTS system galactitol-specific IIA component